jgi:hypothetical protein
MDLLIPALRTIHRDEIRPGDILWGWEEGANGTRKGWHVESEPITVDQRGVRDGDGAMLVNSWVFIRECQPEHFLTNQGG